MSRVDNLMSVVKTAASLRAEGKFNDALELLSKTIAPLPTGTAGMSRSLFDELRHPISSLRAARAHCHIKLGALNEAMVDCTAASMLTPADPSIKLLLAHVHYLTSDVQAAAKVCSEVIAECSGANGEMEEMCNRASRLLRRCAVDRKFDRKTADSGLLEMESYDNDEDFEKLWEPGKNACASCGKVMATSPRREIDKEDEAAITLVDLYVVFSKRLSTERLMSLVQGSACHRVRIQLPATYAAVAFLHYHRLMGDLTVVDILFHQMIASCPDQRSDLQLLSATLFGTGDRSEQLFRGGQSNRLICSSIVSKISQYISAKRISSAVEKFLVAYSAADILLVDRGFGKCLRSSSDTQANVSITEIVSAVADDVANRPLLCCRVSPCPANETDEKYLWRTSVAAAMFPLCAALFGRHCGDAVQGFFSQQKRRSSDVASERAMEVEVDGSRAAPEEGCEISGSDSKDSLFSYPVTGASSDIILSFVHVLAPLLRQYYLKRSSSESKDFAREIFNTFAPKEIHGQLKKVLCDYLNVVVV